MAGSPAAGLEPVASAADLDAHARRIAAEISRRHPGGVTIVGVLKDGVVFLADVLRHVTVPVQLDFVQVAAYDGTQQRTHLVKDLDHPIEGRPVVLVAGLVDTGLSLDFLRRHLLGFGPASLEVCALADRAAHRIIPVDLAYVAVSVGNAHVVGCGLDHRGRHRNVAGLWSADLSAVSTEDPDPFRSLAPR